MRVICFFNNLGPQPSAPWNVSAHLQDGVIYIKWNPPVDSPVQILYYIIKYRTQMIDQWLHLTNGEIYGTSYDWKTPSFGVIYYFQVSKV